MIKDRISAAFKLVTVKNLYRLFGLVLIVVPLSFYVSWSIAYDTWTDVGLYSFTAPLLLFGVLILMLTEEKYRPAPAKN